MKHLNRQVPATFTLLAQVQNAYNILSLNEPNGAEKPLYNKFKKVNDALKDFLNEIDKISEKQRTDALLKLEKEMLPLQKKAFLRERYSFISEVELDRL